MAFGGSSRGRRPGGRTYPSPEPLPEDLEDIPGNFSACFVAVEQDRRAEAVVGLAAIVAGGLERDGTLPDFVPMDRPTARLHWVTVAPERWRLGIGERLTATAIRWARDSGFGAVILETTIQQEGAQALYETMGFKELGHSVNGEWEQVWYRIEV